MIMMMMTEVLSSVMIIWMDESRKATVQFRSPVQGQTPDGMGSGRCITALDFREGCDWV